MKKNFVLSAAAIVVATALVFTACGGKNGGSSGSGKANPATDFGYDLTEDGQGIVILKYTGGPGKVVIPAKIEDMPVVEIGNAVFSGKEDITAITIPNSVTKIGTGAFEYTAITSIVIPDSVTELGDRIFFGCKALTEIRLSDNLEHLPELFPISDSPALQKANLPKNLKRINHSAFAGCGELIDLVIPDTLQSLEFGNMRYGDWSKSSKDPITFGGCSKLPIKTRQRLQALGYTGGF
jgi:hypothetical protein